VAQGPRPTWSARPSASSPGGGASRRNEAEVREVLDRDEVRSKLRLGEDDGAEFFSRLEACAEVLPEPPPAFALPRDPDDEIYTDVAVAGHARYLVSWNKRHLNYLMEGDTPEGADFRARYPGLKIVTPVEFLEELRASRPQTG